LNLIHVHHRSPHHASKSGYSRISDYIPVRSIYGITWVPYAIAKIFSRYHSIEPGIYDAGSVWKEAELLKYLRGTRNQNSVVHYLNAERDVRYFVKYKRFFPSIKFCATFHKPPAVLQQTIKNPAILSNLDAAIAVGENQVEFLKEKLQLENVVFIPHGVDTKFFRPKLLNEKEDTIIFVGQHLRDFEVFNYCIPRIAEKIKNLKVHVVIHWAYQHKITPHKSIEVHTNISDKDLQGLYNNSSLLFLPLKDVTACNSILEGLACGLPVVTTDVGGNSFYLEGTKNILVPKGENYYYIDAITKLLSNPGTLKELAKSSREKALTLSWEKTAEKVEAFYKNLVTY